MAINPSLLIAAPILQDYFVDKDTGLPLVAGIITLYTDSTKTTLKPWYTQQGTNPPYNYVLLNNPMTLSAIGTIQDTNGNDVIPYFYPYTINENGNLISEPYFIEVKNSNGQLQFTRSNFPFLPTENEANTIDSNDNLICNGVFWRNIASDTTINASDILTNTININGVNLLYGTLAPSQHDGFTMPDILYFKDVVGGTETLSFETFTSSYEDNVLNGDPTPQYFLDINCTGTGGEAQKFIQIPINSSIYALSGYAHAACTLQTINVIGGTDVNITLGIFQYLGTTATSPDVEETNFQLSGSWTKLKANLPIPSAQTSTGVSSASDGGLYLRIGLPINTTMHIRLALPSFYLSESVPTDSFQTNDQVNAIISSPRTGDVRTSINSFNPYGFVLCNNGVLSKSSSGITLPTNMPAARQNVDTWQLYNLIWSITNVAMCPIYTNIGVLSTKTTAYNDFNLNKQLSLTKMLGRSLIGLPTAYSFGYANTGVFSVSDASLYYMGCPVILSNLTPGSPFTAGTVYYVVPILPLVSSPTQFYLSDTYAHAIASYVNGSPTNVIFGGSNGSGNLSFAMGGYFGEFAHSQSEDELAAHNHPGSTLQVFPSGGINPGRVTKLDFSNVASTTPLTITTDGRSLQSNIVQPSTYINVFLKL